MLNATSSLFVFIMQKQRMSELGGQNAAVAVAVADHALYYNEQQLFNLLLCICNDFFCAH